MAGGGDTIRIYDYSGNTTLYGAGVSTNDTIGDILGLSWNSGGAVTALAISIGGTPLPNNTTIANSGAYGGGGEWIFYDVTPSTKKITKILHNGEEYELGGAEYSAGSGISISSGNEISNSGVLSVNGQTGNVTIESGGITNDTTGTTTTVAKIWAGTEAEYSDLATKDENTIFYVF